MMTGEKIVLGWRVCGIADLGGQWWEAGTGRLVETVPVFVKSLGLLS